MTPYSPEAVNCSFCQSAISFGKVLRNGQILCRGCEVCLFFEHRLSLTADFAGQPFLLMGWTREVLRDLFGTLDEEGLRMYKDIYLELPKKNTKTTLCAGLVVFCLVSAPGTGTEVYSAATTKDQAGQVFNAAVQMVRSNKSLRERLRVIPSSKRMVRVDDPSSFYAALSADGDIHDGIQPAFVVRDELHRWRTRKAYDLNEILERGMITRKESMVIDITTAGVADESPLCWRRHEYARQIREGVFKDRRFYGRVWAADEGLLKADPTYWTSRAARVAANPSHEDNGGYLKDSVLEDLCTKAQNDPIAQADYKRYHLNVWGQKATRWMPMDVWNSCGGETRPVVERYCYAGLDLASTTDLTSLVLVFPDETDGSFDVLPFFWMPEGNVRIRELRDHVPYSQWVKDGFIETTAGNVIDTRAIRKRIEWARELFDLRELAYDPHGAQELVNLLIDDGVVCVPCKQGYTALSAPMHKLMEIAVSGKLRHANHPVLTWNADCVEVRSDGNDLIRPVKPERATSNKRIDGIVALIEGLDRAVRNENAGISYSQVYSV